MVCTSTAGLPGQKQERNRLPGQGCPAGFLASRPAGAKAGVEGEIAINQPPACRRKSRRGVFREALSTFQQWINCRPAGDKAGVDWDFPQRSIAGLPAQSRRAVRRCAASYVFQSRPAGSKAGVRSAVEDVSPAHEISTAGLPARKQEVRFATAAPGINQPTCRRKSRSPVFRNSLNSRPAGTKAGEFYRQVRTRLVPAKEDFHSAAELGEFYRQVRTRLVPPLPRRQFRPEPEPEPQPEPEPVPAVSEPEPLPWPADAVEAIIRAVATEFGIPRRDIVGTRGNPEIVLARHVAMALCRRFRALSTTRIGRRFGRRDHSTVLHAIRRMAPLMACAAATLSPDATPSDWARFMRAKLVAGFVLSAGRKKTEFDRSTAELKS
jgi:hypothetical protein